MPQVSDLEYILVLEGEQIPLGGSVTLGRHLDNDLVLAGEDVLDYHLRIEVGVRGPQAFPWARQACGLTAWISPKP